MRRGESLLCVPGMSSAWETGMLRDYESCTAGPSALEISDGLLQLMKES